MAGTVPATSRDGALTVTDDNGNSETLLYHLADHTLDGLMPDGAQPIVAESAGAVVGLRKGARALPTFSVSCHSAASLSAFEAMLMGTTSGFTSTSVDIGDLKTTNLSWTFNYGAENRAYSMDDCHWTKNKGSGDTFSGSYTATVYGIVKARDEAGNFVTLIAAR